MSMVILHIIHAKNIGRPSPGRGPAATDAADASQQHTTPDLRICQKTHVCVQSPNNNLVIAAVHTL